MKMNIGLMTNESSELLTGILAILKSGNCFVPINPVFPKDRIRFIIKDCSIDTLLTDKTNHQRAQQIVEETPTVKYLVCIDDISILGGKKEEKTRVSLVSSAYVIYTSGSTGKPKGVPITHLNLIPLFYWFRDYFQLGVHTRVMQNLSYTFDFGIFEILSTILFGGRFYIINKAIVGNFSFYVYFIDQRQINSLHTTPVFFNNLAASGRKMPFIKLLHLGGERLTGSVVKNAVNATPPGCFIYNGYGPTEASINCAIFSLSGENIENNERDIIPIGRPSAFHEIYILDRFHNLQPIGAAGELCIAGPGLSQGYLNRPELTKQKFLEVQKPFFKRVSGPRRERVYRTGDLGRWLTDGNIEFLGRIDQQVKVRGFRIELEEIENCLLKHRDIKEAVVIAKEYENGLNYLCAYIVARSAEHLTVSQLREYLSKQLPDYMIPAYFIHLGKIPLTPNGKIDRKTLPEPDETFIDTDVEYVAPVTDTEKKLASIWQGFLAVKRVGVMDDFFQLGGDSILVNRCIASIRENLQVEIPLRKFFEQPFIKALAEGIEKQEQQISSIKPAKRVGEIPLSYAQERLWFLQELDVGNMAYFVPRVIRMKGQLDISLIERTFSEIIRRHEILRTTFHTVGGHPVQQIHPPYPFRIPVIDWSELEKLEQEQRAVFFLNEEGRRPFDFERGPLLRVTFLKLAGDEHLFVLTEHHLIHDGWTQGVLLNEFIAVFTAYVEGKVPRLPELVIQYADFAIWQRNHLSGEVLERHLNYWKEKLSGLEPLLELPADRPRPPVISGKGELEIVRLPGPYTLRLKEFSRKYGITLFMTMLAAFKVLLYRYTGVEDLCVGTGVANRRYKEMEGMLGMVINTLPLRTQVKGEMSFKQCLSRVKETCLEAYQHEDTPFGKIVEVMQPERNLSYTPLFQVLFSFMDTPSEQLRLPGLELELLPTHNRSAKFDINVVVVPPLEQEENETGETLVEWEYNTDIFSTPTITRMVSHYGRLLEEGLIRPETSISKLSLMSEGETKQVLYEFNDTETDYPWEKTIHELFVEQALKTPDRTAVFSHGRTLSWTNTGNNITYNELNNQSNQLAHLLIEKGVLADDIVSIMMERSIGLIIGIIGVLKAGAAYLPIDTDYPQERIDYMLKESGTKLLVNEKFFGGSRGVTLLRGEPLSSGSLRWNETNVPKHPFVTRLPVSWAKKSPPIHAYFAYVMYTSGSTGQPKGVVVTHRNVVRLVKNTNFVPLTEETRILQTGAPVFDATTFEIWGSLLNGGQLVLGNKEILLDAYKLGAVLCNHHINTLWLSAPLFNQLVQQNIELFASLKYLLVGGDVLSPMHINGIKRKFPFLKIINGYGPTENTTFSTTYLIEKEFEHNIPIGRPIANSTAYIYNSSNRLTPIGVVGELYVGGDGVACGYLNNPELTAEKFSLIKSVSGSPYRRGRFFNKAPLVYRTGDLARWLPDGNIEFSGRRDFQVKVRGFRVELGEIENRLLKHENIRDAVVILKEDLVAYIVLDKEIESERLREYLAEKLPAYMTPTYFMQMERIPLTSNGKVDRKALPDPVFKAKSGYKGPRNEIEEKLTRIWAEVLGGDTERVSQLRTSIGIDSDFFKLGGHSLKASILTTYIHKELNVKIPLVEIFENPTIEGLAKYIRTVAEDKYISMEPTEEREYYELSSAQKRLYILYRMDETGVAYNIPYVVQLEGSLNSDHLEGAFRKLIDRHESLRTSFESIGGMPVQRIHNDVAFKIEILEVGDHGFGFDSFIRAFDLSKAPLLRVGLVKEKAGKYILLVDMHHIISDGTSANLLMKEFMALYEGRELPELQIQYKDFSQWQNDSIASGKLKKQEVYWLDRFAGELPSLDMPTDFPRPMLQSFTGDTLSFNLEEELFQRLNESIKASETTLYIMLLTVYSILLSKYSRQTDIIIGSPTAGRNHADLEKIVGLLIETVTMRNYPVSGKPFKAFLEEVKGNTLTAFENQAYPFRELIKNTAGEGNFNFSRNPMFDAMLIVQNMEIVELKIPQLKLTPYTHTVKHAAKVDLTLTAIDMGEGVNFILEYCTDLFKEERMERLVGHFINILREVVQNPGVLLARIDMLSDEEKRQLLEEFNGLKISYPESEIIHELFEAQVERGPDHIAVIARETSETHERFPVLPVLSVQPVYLTYCQLNEQSNRLARLLIEEGVVADNIIGIKIERSLEMIIGIFGILKAGGAYLPIDPDYPQERIDYMLKDSGVKFLVNEKFFRGCRGAILQKSPPAHTKLAYIIYTSGSTGKPKGVMVEHINLVHYVRAFGHEFAVNPGDTVLQQASYSFDAFAEEIYPALLAGGRIAIPAKNEVIDIDLLSAFILKNKITIVDCSPLLLNELDKKATRLALQGIRIFISGGDVLKGEYIANLLKTGAVYNTYGPTETTICAAYYKCPTANISNVPIGKPVAGYIMYILAESGHLVPIGVAGELCIAGAGVTRGYLNNPELTAEKFNRSYKTYICYKTGDLARRLQDGNIEFLGRIDRQIKIRGFRIELGEIEGQLLRHTSVKEAVVIDRGNEADKYLCAYIVSHTSPAPTAAELRDYLSTILPGYMTPSFFVLMEKIPVTPNGKLDRKALPDPDITAAASMETAAPRDFFEETLVDIWAEVLGIEPKFIGIDTSYFELGGHSLNATRMTAKVNKLLNVKLPLVEVFRTPRIRGLANYIRSTEKDPYRSIEPTQKKEYYALSAAQKRLYVLQQMDPDCTGYNISVTVLLKGKLEIEKLAQAFKKLIRRHESLRTSFLVIGKETVQRIHNDVSFEIEILGSREQELLAPWAGPPGTIIKSFIRPFDLSSVPLMRVGLLAMEREGHILIVDIHHIISDAVSHRVLVQDFILFYKGAEPEPLKLHYKDYCEWWKQHEWNETFNRQETYWLKRFEGKLPVLELPGDFPRPQVQSFEGRSLSFNIEKDLAEALKKYALEEGATLQILMKAIFHILLAKLGDRDDIITGTTIAGRGHADLGKIIGLFVNTLPIRTFPSGEKTFKHYLKEVKEISLNAYENQDYPFDSLVKKVVGIHRDSSRNPIFDIMFEIQSAETGAADISKLEIPGLELIPYPMEINTTKFDQDWVGRETADGISFSVSYSINLFKPETVELMAERFVTLSESVIANPMSKIVELDYRAPLEKELLNQVLAVEFNF